MTSPQPLVPTRPTRFAGFLVLALLCATCVWLAKAARPAEAERPPPVVTLQAGDTIWGLAQRYAPERVDPRAYVDVVIDLNRLREAPRSGQRIRLPAESDFLRDNP